MWLYFIGFAVVSAWMLNITNRSDDPWPGITAMGCIGIGILWPIVLAIVVIGFLISSIPDKSS